MNRLSNPLEDDPEWKIVQKVQAGQVNYFEELIKKHEKPVFNFLFRFLGDYHDAEEVAQEVFLAAYRSISQFRGESRFSPGFIASQSIRPRTGRKSLTQLPQLMSNYKNL